MYYIGVMWFQGGDVATIGSLLPEQLLVDILAERFQVRCFVLMVAVEQCTECTIQYIVVILCDILYYKI